MSTQELHKVAGLLENSPSAMADMSPGLRDAQGHSS